MQTGPDAPRFSHLIATRLSRPVRVITSEPVQPRKAPSHRVERFLPVPLDAFAAVFRPSPLAFAKDDRCAA